MEEDNPPASGNQTETYDGTSWTETADLATARQELEGHQHTSTFATGFISGRRNSSCFNNATEEFNKSTNVITAAAWASGTALNTARFNLGGCWNCKLQL